MEKYILKNNVNLVEVEDNLALIYYYGNRYFMECKINKCKLEEIFKRLNNPISFEELSNYLIDVEKDILHSIIRALLNNRLIEIYIDTKDEKEISNIGLYNFFEFFSRENSNNAYLNIEKINKGIITIIDAGNVGIYIAEQLITFGFKKVYYHNKNKVNRNDISEHPNLYNIEDMGKYKVDILSKKFSYINFSSDHPTEIEQDFAIVCGSWFDLDYFKNYNKLFKSLKKIYLPIIEDYFGGTIGPIIGLEDGPCFNCIINRRKSNMKYLNYYEKIEKYYIDNRTSLSLGNELFTRQLANAVVVEIIKYITNILYTDLYHGLYEFDFLNHRNSFHEIFKYIDCDICGINSYTNKVNL